MVNYTKLLINIIYIIASILLFLLYGYFELVYSTGFFISILLGCYLLRYNSSLASRSIIFTILVCQLIATFYSLKSLMFLFFLLLDLIFIINDNTNDDTIVQYKPFEEEIRKLLFNNEPSLLHQVDQMLDKYKGSEKILYNQLYQKYHTKRNISPIKEINNSNLNIHNNKNITVPEHSPTKYNHINKIETNITHTRNQIVNDIIIKIKDIFQKYDPRMLGSLNLMLLDYQGREEELLKEVEEEYCSTTVNLPSLHHNNDTIYSKNMNILSPMNIASQSYNQSYSSTSNRNNNTLTSPPSVHLTNAFPFSQPSSITKSTTNDHKYNNKTTTNNSNNANQSLLPDQPQLQSPYRNILTQRTNHMINNNNSIATISSSSSAMKPIISSKTNSKVAEAILETQRLTQARIDARFGAKRD